MRSGGDDHPGGACGSSAEPWKLAGQSTPDHDTNADEPGIIDLDATLVPAPSGEQHAAPTFDKIFGHHALGAWADHGPAGTGEPLAVILWPGNAGSNPRR
ncbi:transposase [Saccharopolyspora erythraea]|uniref:Transposase n=2 Tax=Saccharopolyspora erythraea TaxID=1836 RepID=A4FKZ2_SACEN|nr:transposase [Saccharopolyspora erythraea D]QRK88429.1 transposase [Saccharopolyspora erythraea]CAM04717.1 transposase [Saccharopolyspora erythraea NRRL 2338]